MAEAPPEEDFSKLPLEEKLSHKVWRARVMGYEEATKLFRRIDNEKSSEYNKYAGMMKKFVVDTNALAQEKALEATLAFVENAAVAERTCEAVVAGIVIKCLNARLKTKQAGIDICLMYTEIEQQAVVQEEITKGLSNKQPKIVTACILVLRTMLEEFGARVVNVKLLLKAMPAMFEHNDKNVRAEAKLLAVEVYRWMGAPLRGILEKNLKPVQMKELDEEWGKLSGGPAPVPKRQLRSQQLQVSAPVGGGGMGGADGGGDDVGGAVGGASEAIDPYDLLDPVDVLSQMAKDFFTRVVDPKWKERKEVLDNLLPLAQSPKISPGDYGELMKALRKVITKDSNVMVVAVAGNIVAGLATGLRKSFQSYAPNILGGIFEKFKEKKQLVVVALRDAADAAYLSTTLGNIQEQALEALENKNPCVKSETLLFLCRCFQQCTTAMLPKASLKAFCPVIIKQIDSADPTVREAAFETIATLIKVVGERPMNIYIESIDKTKMAKIQEHKEKVELKIKVGLISSPMAKPKTSAAPPSKPKVTQANKPAVLSHDVANTSLDISFEEDSKPLKKKPAIGSRKKEEVKGAGEAEGTPEKTGGGGGGGNETLLDFSFEDDAAVKPHKKKPVLSSTKNPPKRRSKRGLEEGEEEGEKKEVNRKEDEEDKSPAVKPAPKKVVDAETKSVAKPKKKATSGGGGKAGRGKGGTKGKGGGRDEVPDPPEPAIASEELEDKANEVLPPGLLAKFDDPKWKERLEACEKMKEFVEGLPGDEMHSLLMIKVLARKPGWKESNFQVMKAKFSIVAVLAERAAIFGRKSTSACLPALVEKLCDVKVKTIAIEVLMLIAERMTLNFTSLQVMKASFDQKSPKVHSESLEWLKEAVTSFGFLINLKPHIDYIKKGFGASNPAVRTSTMNLLSTVYMYVGAQVRMFFEDEKAALLKQIDEAFEKMSGQSPPAPTRGPNVRGDEEEVEEGEVGGANKPVSLADLMPKVDISGQIKSALIAELSDKNWKIRGEGLTKVQEILAQAKFIQPSLGELPGALKARLGDSNKNHIITTVNIISTLATAMGSTCVKFTRSFVPGVLQNLADAKPHVRAACVSCLNVWIGETTLVPLIEGEFISTALTTESPNLRTELLAWLEEKLPLVKGKLPAEGSTIIPPLYVCLEDRNGEVRKKAQAVIPVIMGKVGYDAMLKHAGKLKGSSKQTVKTLLDKHRSSATPTAQPTSTASGGVSGKKEIGEVKSRGREKQTEKTEEPASKKTAGGSGGGGKSGSASKNKSGPTKQKKGVTESSGPPLIYLPNGKEQRLKDDEKLKILRWNFNSPRVEHVLQLKDQLQPCVSPELLTQMCHDDFKHHLKAIDTLTKAVSGPSPPYREAAISCVDLLLRWVTLRFFDTNTTVNMKCLEFLHTLFQMLINEEDYRMSDYEAYAFIPYLVQKVGDAKEPVRKGVRGLFRDICSVFSSTKLFGFVLDGLKSKNARQRTECLEELGVLIQNNGMVVCGASPQKTVPLIAAQISDRDNTVRTAALNTFVIIHGNVGDGIHKFTSQLSEKDISLLDEKIRRYGKKVPQTTPTATPPDAPPSSLSANQTIVVAGRGRGRGGGGTGGRVVTKLSLKPAISAEKLTPDPQSHDPPHPTASPPLNTPATTGSSPEQPAKPILVPGPYQLDWSKYEIAPRPPPPKLAEYDRSVFREPDPPYPRFATHRLLKNPPVPVTLSPPRLATTSTAINYIISQVTSSNREEGVKALKQMEGVISNSRYIPALVPHVDHLLRAIFMQLKITFTTPLATADDPQSQQQVMEHAKRLVSCVVAVFNEAKLALSASLECLCEVETAVLSYLCDNRLLKLEEVAQLNRAFNYLMYRICENCDKTALFGSLLRVLLVSVSSDGSHTKLTELSMKCIWKITRQIPQHMSGLNLDELLKEMQAFFHGYAHVVPSPKSDDKPSRTAKTILFHLTEHMGAEILDHLSLVPEQSRVAIYVRKTLAKKRLSGRGGGGGQGEGVDGDKGSRDSRTGSTKSSDSPHSPFLHDALSLKDLVLLGEIIDKLTPATEYQGLKELYSFQLAHPDVDVPSLFNSQSASYRSYIVKGLELMKEEKRLADAGETPAPFNSDMVASDFYLQAKKRSRELREKTANLLNIDLTQPVRSTPVAGQLQAPPTQDENVPTIPSPELTATTKAPIGSAHLEDFRRRLEMLKGSK